MYDRLMKYKTEEVIEKNVKSSSHGNGLKACFSQNAAKTAQELIVAVSRIDTWKRNRNLI